MPSPLPMQQTNHHLSQHGIVTELANLLRSRHWASNLKLFSRHAARSLLLGNVRSRYRGRGMEFEEVRRYQPGDDVRTIDWKVSARTQGTFTKLFCEERERPCHIIVDQRSALFFGSKQQFKSVLAAELASAIAWGALAGGDRVGGQVIGDQSELDSRSRRNKQAVLQFIHNTHELNQTLALPITTTKKVSPTGLASSLEECRRITRPGTAIFIISDFHDFDQASAKALSLLGRHADLTLFQISDPFEETLPVLGNIAVSNGQQSKRMHLSATLVQKYKDTLNQRQKELELATMAAQAHYAKVSTEQTARDVLTSLYGR